MMYAKSDKELEIIEEFCHQSKENVQTLVNTTKCTFCTDYFL